MIALLLLAAEPSVIDAERAFAAAAQKDGQWTAFRRFAAPDAVMFVPEPVKAADWLKDRKDPPQSVRWWPTKAWISCDGHTAVTTGGVRWADGRDGYFTTLWGKDEQAKPKWRWDFDHGDTIDQPRPEVAAPLVRQASCTKPSGTPAWPHNPWSELGGKSVLTNGYTRDNSLLYRWFWLPKGVRAFALAIWNGTAYEVVLSDYVVTGERRTTPQ